MNKMLGSIIATAALALSVSVAQAEPANVYDLPDLEIGLAGCTVLNGNGNAEFAASGKITITNGRRGSNSKIQCHVDVNVPANGKAKVWDSSNTGLGCWTGDALTYEWKNVVTASGKSNLICHFNGSAQ